MRLVMTPLVIAAVASAATFATPTPGETIQVDEQGNLVVDGSPGAPGAIGVDPVSGHNVLIYSLPFAGNPGDVVLLEPPSGPSISDIIRFPGNGTMELFSLLENQTTSAAAVNPGLTNIKVSSVKGYAPGNQIEIDPGPSQEVVTITSVGTSGAAGTGISFAPALENAHASGADISEPIKLADVQFLPSTMNPHVSLDEVDRGTIWQPGLNGVGGDSGSPNLQYIFVPEPSSSVLAGFLLVGLAVYGWRRRRLSWAVNSRDA